MSVVGWNLYGHEPIRGHHFVGGTYADQLRATADLLESERGNLLAISFGWDAEVGQHTSTVLYDLMED